MQDLAWQACNSCFEARSAADASMQPDALHCCNTSVCVGFAASTRYSRSSRKTATNLTATDACVPQVVLSRVFSLASAGVSAIANAIAAQTLQT